MNQEFLTSLRRGERNAVEQLYQTSFSYCSGIVLKNYGTMDDARDLFQEALIILFQNLRKDDFVLKCQVRTYLYSVMRNLWLKRLRGRSNQKTDLILDDGNKEIVAVQDSEIEEKKVLEKKHDFVLRALNLIAKECKDLLMNFYFNKMALKDIGILMGYSDNFVKVKKNRCMNGLKDQVRQIQQSKEDEN